MKRLRLEIKLDRLARSNREFILALKLKQLIPFKLISIFYFFSEFQKNLEHFNFEKIRKNFKKNLDSIKKLKIKIRKFKNEIF